MTRREKRQKKHTERKSLVQKWEEFCKKFGFMSSPEYINAQRRYQRRIKKEGQQ